MLQFQLNFKCGNSSVVEHNLAMVGVASSTLVSRSIFLLLFLFSTAFSITIKESLANELQNRFENIVIEQIEVFAPKNIPANIADFALKSVQITSISGAKGGAKATFSGNGKPLEINFKFEVNASVVVLVATKDIKSGEQISEQNTALLPIDLAKYEQNTLTKEQSGKLAKHNIKSGNPIKSNNLSARKAVLRGDTITLSASDGGVSVQVSVVAMQDGDIGDIIEVRNGSVRQRAQIISKTQAVVR